jgi:hypothetical protein
MPGFRPSRSASDCNASRVAAFRPEMSRIVANTATSSQGLRCRSPETRACPRDQNDSIHDCSPSSSWLKLSSSK